MSMKLDGIDLNSEVVLIEEDLQESGLDKSTVNQTPTYNPSDPSGLSMDRDKGVSGEVTDSLNISGLVSEDLKAEMLSISGDESLLVDMEGNYSESELKEGYSGSEGGVFEKETAKIDDKMDLEIKEVDNVQVEEKIEIDQNQEMGVCEFPQYCDKVDQITLIFDLNSRHQDGICNEGAEGTDGPIGANLPFSVGLAGNTDASNKDSDFTKNQHVLNKEAVTNGQSNEADANPSALVPKSRGNENQTEKEGEFYVSDLVWGKVRSHPWWPGQIIEPAAASEKAMKYFKKDSYLIAYFGDQTFAWNEASKVKPFQMYFSQMKNQSSAEAFCHAVDGVLDEVSRRVEFGLACQCLSPEISAKVKSQVVVNAGIREESTSIYGGDSFSTAASFIPAKLVNYLEALAGSPHSNIDILCYTIARAQLLAFNRWKGYYQLPIFEELNGISEKDADLHVIQVVEGDLGSKEDDQIASGKGKSPSGGSSRRRRHFPMSDEFKGKKKKRLLDLMSGSGSYMANGENEFKGKASSERASVSSSKKRKEVDTVSSESIEKRRKGISVQRAGNTTSLHRNYSKVGEQIYVAARKLGGLVSPLKSGSRSSHQAVVNQGGNSLNASCSGASTLTFEKSRRGRVIPREYPPTSEILSKLFVAAKSPMEGYSSLTSVGGFFCDFRNSICLQYNNVKKESMSGEQKAEKSSVLEATEAFEFEGVEDSYWTDRIIQSSFDEQVLFELETPVEQDIVTAELEGLDGMNLNSDNQHEMNPVVSELPVENPLALPSVDENSNEYSPTTLILNFTDLESVHSITHLNSIFNRYGPLEESGTVILSKSKRAKVVFKRRSDAETAFSSAGKYSIFGPSLVSYRLKYTMTPRKASSASKTKRCRKSATLVEDSAK